MNIRFVLYFSAYGDTEGGDVELFLHISALIYLLFGNLMNLHRMMTHISQWAGHDTWKQVFHFILSANGCTGEEQCAFDISTCVSLLSLYSVGGALWSHRAVGEKSHHSRERHYAG